MSSKIAAAAAEGRAAVAAHRLGRHHQDLQGGAAMELQSAAASSGGGGGGGGPTVVVSVPSDDKIALATDLVVIPARKSAPPDPPPASEQQAVTAAAEEAMQDLAKVGTGAATGSAEVEFDDVGFEDLELGAADQVPLGEILDKLHNPGGVEDQGGDGGGEGDKNLIRLHAVDPEVSHHEAELDGFDEDSASVGGATISAMVKVATLDLSDPESIHRHLTQLNDTVLKVTTSYNLQQLGSPGLSVCSSMASPPPPPSSSEQADLGAAPRQDAAATATISSAFLPVMSASATATAIPIPSPSAGEKPSVQPESPSKKSTASSSAKGNSQVCSICAKSFSNGSALAKHRLTHSEERRYQCTTCGKAFKRQDHLNGHLLTHRSTKPFACHADGCGKSYCDARSLRRHKENHHGCVSARSRDSSAEGKKVPGPDMTHSKAMVDCSSDTSSPIAVSQKELISPQSIPSSSTISNEDNHNRNQGLSAQQHELMERLFAESKNIVVATTTECSKNPNASSSNNLSVDSKKTDASLRASSMAAKALAAVQNQAFQLAPLVASPCPRGPDGEPITPTAAQTESNSSSVLPQETVFPPLPLAEKPVSCTMCSRRFKNIPALNGHMRLHGGYYKKDSEGKRIASNAPPGSPIKGPSETNRPVLKRSKSAMPALVTKKRALGGDVPLGQLPSEAMMHLNTLAPGGSKDLGLPSPNDAVTNPALSLPFKCLPPPDTSQLLANLEQKNLEEQQQMQQQQQQGMFFDSSPLIPGSRAASSSTISLSPQEVQGSPIVANPSVANVAPSVPSSLQLPLPAPLASSLSKSPPPLVIRSANGLASQPRALAAKSHFEEEDHPQNVQPCPVSKTQRRLMLVDASSDKSPKIGPEHQVQDIPDLVDSKECTGDSSVLLWSPATASKISGHAMRSYLTLASSCLVPGGSRNEEAALGSLQAAGGNLQQALLSLMSKPEADEDELEPSRCRPWSDAEVAAFYEGLVRHRKDFAGIAATVGTRSAAECVEYYYLWKNVCREESRSFKAIFAAAAANATSSPPAKEGGKVAEGGDPSAGGGQGLTSTQTVKQS